MHISLRWINEFGKTKLRASEVTELLSQGGIPVDGVRRLDAECEGVVVGEVRSVSQHPNADRLKVCSVRLSAKETRQIVCGAPNVAVGQKVAVARPGARLANGVRLEAAAIRGVHSEGMLCAPDELGLGADHAGILVLDPKAILGQPFARFLELDDVSLELEVTPNRADCLSVLGITRDLAALQGKSFSYRAPRLAARGVSALRVTIQDAAACPKYSARLVRGIHQNPTPAWMAARLLASGIRPIHLIVDITNYVMLELGQPLHAFDAARISNHRITVRRARNGETLRTLDGVDRRLSSEMLVIADSTKPIALAGVMGGADTEVGPETKDIILESAHFAPQLVRKTARSLHLLSEASMRFERGIDPAMTAIALDRAAQLLLELGGASLAGPARVVGRGQPRPKPIALSLADVNDVLNTDFSHARVKRFLASIGCTIRGGAKTMTVLPPTWRVDLKLPEDLIEEIARLYGYDRLKPTHLQGELQPAPIDPLQRLSERSRDLLAQLGYSEVYTRETERGAKGDPKTDWVIANPIDPDESVLRRSLLPNLERVAEANLARSVDPKLAVFEVGTVFAGRSEEQFLGATSWRMANRSWAGDVVKGHIASWALSLGLPEPQFRGEDILILDQSGKEYRIGRWTSAELTLMGRNQYLCQSWEISLSKVLTHQSRKEFLSPNQFPPVKRDLALWVPNDLDASRLFAAMHRAAPDLVSIVPFDVYTKDGKLSVALHLVFQRADRTLAAQEVDSALTAILKTLEHDLKIIPRR